MAFKSTVHKEFELNGNRYNGNELKEVAYSFVKEGEPFEEEVGAFLIDWFNARDYIEVNTSGSTGAPKAIRIRKEFMVNSAEATAKHFKLPEKTTALLCLPADFIAGKMMLVRAMILGWRLDMAQPRVNPLDNVYRRYDFCAMTPFQLDNSIGRLHLIKKLIVGGGVISGRIKALVHGINTKVYETYGMTETVSHIAARRINPKKEKEETIPFKTLSKVSVAQDDRGCLIVKAPQVSTDPVVTNDVVELISYKKFIWLGRADNVVNSGGIKLHPERIELKLAPHMDVPFFIAGLPDDSLGERLVLLMETRDDSLAYAIRKKLDAKENFSNLEKYEFPKEVYYLHDFDRTENGKLKRDSTLKRLLQQLAEENK